MTRPWIIHCPKGYDPEDLSVEVTRALMALLPGDHGLLLVPYGVDLQPETLEALTKREADEGDRAAGADQAEPRSAGAEAGDGARPA